MEARTSPENIVQTESIASALQIDFSAFRSGWAEAYRISVESSGPPRVTMSLRRAGGLVEVAYEARSDFWVYEVCVRHLRAGSAEWLRLASSGAIEEFWSMPEPAFQMGLDGTTWRLEGHRDGAARELSQGGAAKRFVAWQMPSSSLFRRPPDKSNGHREASPQAGRPRSVPIR